MNDIKNRGKSFFANKLQSEIFLIISLAVFLPTMIAVIALFYLIFNVTAEQMGIPEAIATSLVPAAKKVGRLLFIALPAAIALILFLAYKITHRIVGPFDRIVRELDDHLAGRRSGLITLRKDDRFLPLVTKINALLQKLKKSIWSSIHTRRPPQMRH